MLVCRRGLHNILAKCRSDARGTTLADPGDEMLNGAAVDILLYDIKRHGYPVKDYI